MNFLEKNALFIKLKNSTAIEADKTLLKKKDVKSEVFSKKFLDKSKESAEILYALIDLASEAEIRKNREKYFKSKKAKIDNGKDDEPAADLPDEGGKDDEPAADLPDDGGKDDEPAAETNPVDDGQEPEAPIYIEEKKSTVQKGKEGVSKKK